MGEGGGGGGGEEHENTTDVSFVVDSQDFRGRHVFFST